MKLLVGEPKTQNQLNANKNQGTGFLKACYFGQYEIVSYLLEDADTKGIEIKSSNHKGSTALHLACWQGKLEIVKLLLEDSKMKDQLNSQDKDGWTGFHSACAHGQDEIVSLFLKEADSKGIDINAATKDGENGLDIARRKDHTKIVAILSEGDIRKSVFEFGGRSLFSQFSTQSSA